MKFAIAAALAAFSLAGAAAADTTITATLAKPQTAPTQFIAAHAVWNCAGSECKAQIAPDDSAGLDGCRDLAAKIGPVASFAGDAKTLDARSLEKCNKWAATPAKIGTASR